MESEIIFRLLLEYVDKLSFVQYVVFRVLWAAINVFSPLPFKPKIQALKFIPLIVNC